MSKKHFDYEDDHDWDDSIDYKAKGMTYWYGKYYNKADIDALSEEKSANVISWVVVPLAIGVVPIIISSVKDAIEKAVMKAKKRKQQEELEHVVRELQMPPFSKEVRS